jgi:putative DNA methylase
MASVKPNSARLKQVSELTPRDLTSGELGGTLLSELLIAMQELINDQDPKAVLGQMRTSLDAIYFHKRLHLAAMAQYLAEMWGDLQPQAAQKAEILANRIRNEGI